MSLASPLHRPSVVPAHTSLVRYDNPILVSTTKEGRALGGAHAEKAKRRAEEKQQLTPTEDILNSILPPRSVREQ
jgi:dynein light intermediate chain